MFCEEVMEVSSQCGSAATCNELDKNMVGSNSPFWNKVASLFHQKKKAVKLTWTQAWRRFNKKIKVDEITKRKTRKTTRVQKAIVGMSLDEIMRRKNEKPEEREKKLEAAKKEVKARQQKKVEAKRVDKSKKAASQKAPAPKNAPAAAPKNVKGKK